MTARTHHIEWPPRPCTAAYNLEGLTMALYDIVHCEGASGIGDNRRTFLQLVAIAAAAEVYAQVLAKFFATRMGNDHELLEMIQDRFEEAGWPIPGAA
jgi:hypothetical protein